MPIYEYVCKNCEKDMALLSIATGTATRLPDSRQIHEVWAYQQSLAKVSQVPSIKESHWLEVADDASEWTEMTSHSARENWPSK